MVTLKFRNAGADDLPKIVEIYNSTVASRMVTADMEEVSVESKQKWFAEHNPETRPLWVVEDADNETVGWVSFSSFHERAAYSGTVEVSIYLDEKCRGKGYGKTILQYCIDNASKFGIHHLVALIFLHNEPSLKLFRYFGFEDWGTLPDVAVLDGVERSLKILGKRIY
ncbi:N-acetyltransferase family protein [Chryseobacterium indologenes]|nr:N-acetyltransferase [Chryseobacterium indologenes]GAE65684.1 putative acetyltransferase [Chryseobacterium indologenes NBRC 14944]MBU3048299.1 GNAT family N-acetyltransferase [Chryseobacterium indologenes]QPQ53935.1 N-acetyltransferase family protein [Chryseobacterium indologenes]QQQ73245.1 N-acetyltransferase [Chryseobacterium indologenes]